MDELQIEAALSSGLHWRGGAAGTAARAHGHARSDAALQALFLQTLAETLARARRADAPPAAAPAPAPLARPARRVDALSAREIDVMERLAAGASNKAIARALDLSVHTVKRHVANILDKLDARSRGEAAARWRDPG